MRAYLCVFLGSSESEEATQQAIMELLRAEFPEAEIAGVTTCCSQRDYQGHLYSAEGAGSVIWRFDGAKWPGHPQAFLATAGRRQKTVRKGIHGSVSIAKILDVAAIVIAAFGAMMFLLSFAGCGGCYKRVPEAIVVIQFTHAGVLGGTLLILAGLLRLLVRLEFLITRLEDRNLDD